MLTRVVAIAFAYFETLVQCGDVNFVQSELERMTTLNKGIEDVGGQDPSIFEFMVSETLDLYNDIIRAMSTGNDAMPILMLKFNDAATSACFVYHLRLLACARLRGNSTQYEPYLGANVGAYINSTIMPVDREIDHICVVLLHDILLEPASIVLDIAYLDRSEGDEVNVHRLPEEANGRDPSTLGPIIYLLYRPGHYDILYRNNQIHVQPVVAMPAPLNVRINRATSFVQHNHDFENPVPALQDTYGLDMTAIAMLPSATPSSLSQFGPPSTTPSPMTDPYTQSSASSWAQQFTPESISAPTPSHPSPPQQQPTVHQLRFSKYNVAIPGMAAENNNTHEPAFTTNTFKNSHYNVAHYNNQNFQPEMYQPDAEEEAPNSGHGKIGGRKRSSEHCLGIKKEK
jgi:ubiquitin thioesterase protein OTUB1